MKAKIRILTRRIKRSYKKDREQWIKGGILTVILLVIVIFAGSCACGKKTVKAPDAESQGVMKITPIPTATPTPVPRQVNKDAVAQSGSVTMVNEYLVQKKRERLQAAVRAALQKSRLLQIRLTAAVMPLEIQQMKKLRPVVEINFTETAL
ncbi:MAG: hypothetical protein ACLTZM_22805 [Ruminococcus sp.]